MKKTLLKQEFIETLKIDKAESKREFELAWDIRVVGQLTRLQMQTNKLATMERIVEIQNELYEIVEKISDEVFQENQQLRYFAKEKPE